MRRLRTVICLLILALTIPAAYYLKRELPSDTQPMIEKKYGGWSGVLRLWVCEDWLVGSGSVAAWVNRCVSTYEKRHPGVYVQPEYVAADTLEAEGIMPPDLILFTPGSVDADRLASLDINAPLRPGLPREARALPVLLGGYLWAYNAALLDGIPDTWREVGAPMAVPIDEPHRLWSAALLALCSSKYSEEGPADAPSQGILDLGLPGDAPTQAPAPEAGTLSCALPEDFAPIDDAWRAFINGEAAAMLVTQREIRRLEALSDQGKGPDWRLAGAGDAAFTDQVMYVGAVEQDSAEKLDLCRAFAAHLLDSDCQGELHRIGVFAVTDAPSGYAVGDNLAAMEQLLAQRPLIVPAPFDAGWRTDAEAIVREFWRSSREPADILALLSERFCQ